ncbi:MAG: transposase [Burkholderiales bacterium]|nr:transposase [Burkholderiales bacterium]
MAGQDFIARFLQHVLPPGFKRIRHYGLLAPGQDRASGSGPAPAGHAPDQPQGLRGRPGLHAPGRQDRDRALSTLRQRTLADRAGAPTPVGSTLAH